MHYANIYVNMFNMNKYHFETMKNGENRLYQVANISSFRVTLSRRMDKLGYKYRSEKEGDGVRVWRIG